MTNGGWRSCTVTVKLQTAVLPDVSTALQVMVLLPIGRMAGEDTEHVGELRATATLSDARTVHAAVAVLRFADVLSAIDKGQVMFGATLSLTTTG